LPLGRRNCSESLLIEIQNQTVRAISYGMRLHLNPFAKSLDKHRHKIFFFVRQKSRRVVIRVRLKQSGAARSQSAVEDDFDRSHSESSVKFVQRRAFHQESLRIRSRTVDGFVDAKLELSFTVEFSHQSDVFVASPGILNLAPPQIDAPLRADNQSL